MKTIQADVLILGSGFGGSLLALILSRAGKSIVMLDRSQHPRFAIGESSTPLADRTLAQMADQYGLPELRALCHWGSWTRACPQLLCGRKRGFTYFDQTCSEDLTHGNFDDRRMLVSASIDNEHSDTHWLRSDVDQFLFKLAAAAGAVCFQQSQYTVSSHQERWNVTGQGILYAQDGRPDLVDGQTAAAGSYSPAASSFAVEAEFVIDATGSSSALLKHLNVPDQTHLLKTNSRSVYAHFAGAVTCERLLQERAIETDGFPYQCDDAAVHQVLSDGWMWQLRYDDDSLSAGFMIDERPGGDRSVHEFASPMDEWNTRIARSFFLSRQFRAAKIVRPATGLQSTRRIQRLAGCGAGARWAALTNTIGFVDPLHSTGIAHTLFSVARLAEILLKTESIQERTNQLQEYSDLLIAEIRCVDELVEGCYEAIPSFRLWCLWGMLYFAAATSMEQAAAFGLRRISFLRADDVEFRAMLREARQRLQEARHVTGSEKRYAENRFATWLKSAIEPWNQVGLFDDTCGNLYSKTAAPADAW